MPRLAPCFFVKTARPDLLRAGETPQFTCTSASCISRFLIAPSILYFREDYRVLLSPSSSLKRLRNFTMRLAIVLLLLPSLTVAEDQKPLLDIAKGWFEQAKAYIPTAV